MQANSAAPQPLRDTGGRVRRGGYPRLCRGRIENADQVYAAANDAFLRISNLRSEEELIWHTEDYDVFSDRSIAEACAAEYGKVNVRGPSSRQRAEAIVSVAHPQFRDRRIAEAEKMHIWKRGNTR